MTTALLSTALLIALVLLVVLERTIRRERREAADLIARHRAELAAERDRAAEERRELYQRIQAPEIAVAEAVRASRPERRSARPIAADDDAAYAARDGRGGGTE